LNGSYQLKLTTPTQPLVEIIGVLLITAVDHDGSNQTTVHFNASPDMIVCEGLGLLQHVNNILSK
jgi:hypothetical protein